MANASLVDGYEDWLRVELRLAAASVDTYLREVRGYLRYLNSIDVSPARAAVEDIVSHLSARRRIVGARTISKCLSGIRSFHSYLVLEGTREDNPAELVERPRPARKIPEVLSVANVDAFLESIDVSTPVGLRDRALFELVYSCGLRVSEACALPLQSISRTELLVRVLGKGSKERLVPLGEAAAEWLDRYLRSGRPYLLTSHRATDKLFVGRHGVGLSRKGVWKRFKEITLKGTRATKNIISAKKRMRNAVEKSFWR